MICGQLSDEQLLTSFITPSSYLQPTHTRASLPLPRTRPYTTPTPPHTGETHGLLDPSQHTSQLDKIIISKITSLNSFLSFTLDRHILIRFSDKPSTRYKHIFFFPFFFASFCAAYRGTCGMRCVSCNVFCEATFPLSAFSAPLQL
jgi:hypothetical protein